MGRSVLSVPGPGRLAPRRGRLCRYRRDGNTARRWDSQGSEIWRESWLAHSTSGVRDRIVAETRGNPLALLELPRRRTLAELAGGQVAIKEIGSSH